MEIRTLKWAAPVLLGVFVAYAAVSLYARQGYALAAFGNIVQSVILAALFGATLLNTYKNKGRTRWFWGAMSLGAALWLVATFMWTWFEVVVLKPVPSPYLGDVLFFIHVVPFMAALALTPHSRFRSPVYEFGAVDFALLLSWWLYLYMFVVIPWQYVHPDIGGYDFSFNLLYILENTALLVGLGILCKRVKGFWRSIYVNVLIASLIYTVGSLLVNRAIQTHNYYTGCTYDLPLVLAMLWFVWTSLLAFTNKSKPAEEQGGRPRNVVVSRLSMLAVLSLPVMALWMLQDSSLPYPVLRFRIIVTLCAIIFMALMIYVKQHLLDRELMRSLAKSQQSLQNLKRLQGQLVMSEKLVSLGQLIAGAAHEINNPLTAIMGYADLLAEDPAVPEDKRAWIQKIGEQARRTHGIVANLLSFAKQIPLEKETVNLNSIVDDAAELRMQDLEKHNIRFQKDLDSKLPSVWGSSSQLLQVLLHLTGNAMDAMKRSGGGEILVSTRRQEDYAVLEVSDSGPGVQEVGRIFDPFYTTKPLGKNAGLGLSICYGIIREHNGNIFCENLPQGGAKFVIRLPLLHAMAGAAGAGRL